VYWFLYKSLDTTQFLVKAKAVVNVSYRDEAARSVMLVGLYQIFFLLLAVCARVNCPFILPARLQCSHCCNTIARLLGNIRPRLDLPLVCHTPNNIGNNHIV